MRNNDSFRLFSSGPEAAKTSVEPPKTEHKTEITPPECQEFENGEDQTNTDDLIVPTRAKDLVKQRSVFCSLVTNS